MSAIRCGGFREQFCRRSANARSPEPASLTSQSPRPAVYEPPVLTPIWRRKKGIAIKLPIYTWTIARRPPADPRVVEAMLPFFTPAFRNAASPQSSIWIKRPWKPASG